MKFERNKRKQAMRLALLLILSTVLNIFVPSVSVSAPSEPGREPIRDSGRLVLEKIDEPEDPKEIPAEKSGYRLQKVRLTYNASKQPTEETVLHLSVPDEILLETKPEVKTATTEHMILLNTETEQATETESPIEKDETPAADSQEIEITASSQPLPVEPETVQPEAEPATVEPKEFVKVASATKSIVSIEKLPKTEARETVYEIRIAQTSQQEEIEFHIHIPEDDQSRKILAYTDKVYDELIVSGKIEEVPAEQPAKEPEQPVEEPKPEQPTEQPAEDLKQEEPTEQPTEDPKPEEPVEQPAEEREAETPAPTPTEAPAKPKEPAQPAEEPVTGKPESETSAPEPIDPVKPEEPKPEQPTEQPVEKPKPEQPTEQPVEESPSITDLLEPGALLPQPEEVLPTEKGLQPTETVSSETVEPNTESTDPG